MLQRLFANLLSNAIYYAASASTITVSATIITSGIGLDGSKEEEEDPQSRVIYEKEERSTLRRSLRRAKEERIVKRRGRNWEDQRTQSS